jgi:hypothetical protein
LTPAPIPGDRTAARTRYVRFGGSMCGRRAPDAAAYRG